MGNKTVLVFFAFLMVAFVSFAHGNSTDFNVIYVIDVSGSMNWPTYLSDSEIAKLPEDVRADMVTYKEELDDFSSGLSEMEKEQFFAGCSYCSTQLGNGKYRNIPPLRDEVEYNSPKRQTISKIENLRNDLEAKTEGLNISKLQSAQKAALSLLSLQQASESLFGVENKVAIVSFSSYANRELILTNDYDEAQEVIYELYADGGTNIGDGISEAFEIIQSEEGESVNSIILLTDGRSNDGWDRSVIMSNFTDFAKQSSIKIDTIGFGMTEDEVDSELLRKLATETGGSYKFAVTPNELSAAFVRIGHQNLQQNIVAEESGTIEQDEEKTIGRIRATSRTERLLITLNWPGSELEMKIKDSKGNLVPESEYSIVKGSNLVVIDMQNPTPDNYEIVAYGKDVPEGTLDYNLIVSEEKGQEAVEKPAQLPKEQLPCIGAFLLGLLPFAAFAMRKE